MAFSGWPEDALDFYDGLEIDNSKAYWSAHKQVYEEKILAPTNELTEELAAEFGEPKLFRPYRDVRFSKDKSPYKTHMGVVIGHSGYIQLSAKGLACGAGVWEMSPEEIARYRECVAGPAGAELAKTVAEAEAAGLGIHGHGALKTVPRGYRADHPRAGLLRYKGLTTWQEWPVEPWLETASAKDRIVAFFRTSRPLTEWLMSHVRG